MVNIMKVRSVSALKEGRRETKVHEVPVGQVAHMHCHLMITITFWKPTGITIHSFVSWQSTVSQFEKELGHVQ